MKRYINFRTYQFICSVDFMSKVVSTCSIVGILKLTMQSFCVSISHNCLSVCYSILHVLTDLGGNWQTGRPRPGIEYFSSGNLTMFCKNFQLLEKSLLDSSFINLNRFSSKVFINVITKMTISEPNHYEVGNFSHLNHKKIASDFARV